MVKNCLVVEDNEISGFVYSEHLRTMGFMCNHITDGALALALCQESMPDIILLDWHMPRIDGRKFLRQLRDMENGDKPIVIVCTCDDTVKEENNLSKMNIAGFLIKPTYHDHLQKKFKELNLLPQKVQA